MRKALFMAILLLAAVPCFGVTHTVNEALTDQPITPTSFTPNVQAGDIIEIATDRVTSMQFDDFIGTAGSKITIRNVSTGKVTISTKAAGMSNGIEIRSSEHIILDGTNHSGSTYGIKVHNSGNNIAYAVRLLQSSDIEVKNVEASETSGGILCSTQNYPDTEWTSANSYGAFGIHDNYIHDIDGTLASGIYMGKTNVGDHPRFTTLDIYNNTITNTTENAIQVQQTGTKASIYGNVITNAGTSETASWSHGIIVQFEVDDCEVYDNEIYGVSGPGILHGSTANGDSDIHDNIVYRPGGGPSGSAVPSWSRNGIQIRETTGTHTVDDNIIIEPNQYALRSDTSDAGKSYSGNIMTECGVNYVFGSPTDGGGNVKEADADDVGFHTWSDDGDHSNDNFITASVSGAVTDATISEEGETSGVMSVDCDEVHNGDCDSLSVAFTWGGSADLTTDFTSDTTSPFTITNKDTAKVVTNTAVDDGDNDDDQTIILQITASSDYIISQNNPTQTIIDNDAPQGSPGNATGIGSGSGSITGIGTGSGTMTFNPT